MSIKSSTSVSIHPRPTSGVGQRFRIVARRRSVEAVATLLLATTMTLVVPSTANAGAPAPKSTARHPAPARADFRRLRLDHSGDKKIGLASYYGRGFAGRRMADGTPMQPGSDNAASRTLPLGTTAKVVNLSDGKSAIVTIRDRGPFGKGRIIDLSPLTARQLGITKTGVAQVEVTPMTVPQPDGTVKLVVAMSEPDVAGVRHGAAPRDSGGN